MPASVVAATKLGSPALRDGLVERDGLVRSVREAPPARLTLVSAPAGWGKTTFVGQWQQAPEEDRPFAWVALDREDNDPVRFWDCVIASLRQILPGLGGRAQAALRAPGTSVTAVVLPLLINELVERGEPVVLVLDDLHLVEDPEIHRSLAFLIDRAPAGLHVVITTRMDPPLPLARLRARGQLAEVRAADLRFNDEEAGAMLSGLGLELAGEELAQVLARSEGWAAGLQLVGLSLRGRGHGPDRAAVLRAGGPHVVEYLTEEVLAGLPGEARAFLLQTAVLERLHGHLCDAVLATTGSEARLEALAAGGLFLTALGDGWFRVHTLVRDVLVTRLEPGLAAPLHARARDWHAAHGSAADAIRHAFAAGGAGAADLVAAHWTEFFNRGELATVASWLATLPDDDERLWLPRVWLALDRGRLDEVRTLLDVAPAAGAWPPLLRGLYAFKRGDLAAASAGLAPQTRGDSAFWRAVAAIVSGATAYWLGHDHGALHEALETAREDDNQLAQIYALGYLSLAAAEAGDRRRAVEWLEEGEDLTAADPGLDEHFVALTLQLARAAEDQRRGARDAALVAGERALELARRGAGAIEVAEALRVVALARRRMGRAVEARRALHEARMVAAGCPHPGRLADRLQHAVTELADDDRDVRDPLSERELAVLRLLPSGLSQREIGGELFVSVNTVKTHVKSIFFKLRVGSREEAVGRARELGLL